MSTKLDSFDGSRLKAFVQSRLHARNLSPPILRAATRIAWLTRPGISIPGLAEPFTNFDLTDEDIKALSVEGAFPLYGHQELLGKTTLLKNLGFYPAGAVNSFLQKTTVTRYEAFIDPSFEILSEEFDRSVIEGIPGVVRSGGTSKSGNLTLYQNLIFRSSGGEDLWRQEYTGSWSDERKARDVFNEVLALYGRLQATGNEVLTKNDAGEIVHDIPDDGCIFNQLYYVPDFSFAVLRPHDAHENYPFHGGQIATPGGTGYAICGYRESFFAPTGWEQTIIEKNLGGEEIGRSSIQHRPVDPARIVTFDNPGLNRYER